MYTASKLLLKSNFIQKYRLFSTKLRKCQEVKIPVAWGHVAGKWWEPFDQRPILALHGWQDNAGTFDRLVPLLNDNVGILAIDLPGHGYSSRLPPGMFYHNMNYPILIKQISEYFNWPKTSLMGHSMGGISCYVYTMLFPDLVDFLICIDGVKPLYKKKNGPRMAEGIKEQLKYDQLAQLPSEPPSYSLDMIKKHLCAFNNNSIQIEHCDHLLNRMIAQSKVDSNKYYFTRDPRLKARIFFNWPQKDLIEGAYRVTTPLLMIKFKGSGYYEDKENFYEILPVLETTSRDAKYHYIDGTHHNHLNNPESINGLINEFLNKHYREDRKDGGITDDIIDNNLAAYVL